MKSKKLREFIQQPLRFHHQDIHEELEALKAMIAVQSELLGAILSKLETNYVIGAMPEDYEQLEKDFLGDIEKGTGIYAPIDLK